MNQPPSDKPNKDAPPQVDFTMGQARALTIRNVVGFVIVALLVLAVAILVLIWKESGPPEPLPPAAGDGLTASNLIGTAGATAAIPFRPEAELFTAPPDGRKPMPSQSMDPERMASAMNETRMGEQYLRANQLDKAESHARKALEIWPNMNSAMRLLGVVYTHRGQFDQAIAVLEKALGDAPFNPEVFNNLATAYMQKKQFDKAEELLLTSLRIQPEYRLAYLNLGLLYLAQGKYAAAVDYLEESVQDIPRDAPARNNLAVALIRLGRMEEARKQLAYLVQNNPDFPATYFNMAVTYALEDNADEAVKWIRQGAGRCTPVSARRYITDPDFDRIRNHPLFRAMILELFPQMLPPKLPTLPSS